jgi:hypothetical protein
LWQLGQAAGTAAGVAKRGGKLPLQDIDVHELQKALIDQGAFVHWPPRQYCKDPPNTGHSYRGPTNPDSDRSSSNAAGHASFER